MVFFSYINYIKNLIIGTLIFSSYKTKLVPGNSLLLKFIPYGCYINNLEIKPKIGSQYARSPGSYAQILNKFKKYVKIKLKSGIKKFFLQNNIATLGIISDFIHLYKTYNINSGFNRRLG